MKKKTTRILAMLLAALLVLSACGGNNSNNNPNNNPGSSATNQESSGIGLTEVEVDQTLTLEQQLEQLKVDNGGTPLTTFRTYAFQSNEMENFLLHSTVKAEDKNVLANCYAFLLENNNYGNLTRGAAESYEANAGNSEWTFRLQSGQKWVNYQGEVKGDLVAQDYVTGLEWTLNYWKGQGANSPLLLDILQGAEDYYNYTSELTEEEGMALTVDNEEFQKVGIKAPDDNTVVYTLNYGAPYFGSFATSAALAPLSQGEVDEIGVNDMVGRDYKRMWCSGAYYISEFISGNSKTLTKNPYYWDPDSTFEEVVITMVEGADRAIEMYYNGELDSVTLNDSNLTVILNEGSSNPYYDYLVPGRLDETSWSLVFNYNKQINNGTVADPDYVEDVQWNTAIANENFRKALYWGIDLYEYLAQKDPLDPLALENVCWSMEGVCSFSDGTDYVDRVKELIGMDSESDGVNLIRFNKEKALEYKEKAIEELTALGVTFPVNIDFWTSTSTSANKTAQIWKECFEDSLGTDFITFTINNYASSVAKEAYNPRLHSFLRSGWSADYADIASFTDAIGVGPNSYFNTNRGNMMAASAVNSGDMQALFEEFTRLSDSAKAITDDTDKRLEAFAQAEAFLIEHALVLPSDYTRSWTLTHVNTYSRVNALYGMLNTLYKNYETSSEPYSSEDMSKFLAAYELLRHES